MFKIRKYSEDFDMLKVQESLDGLTEGQVTKESLSKFLIENIFSAESVSEDEMVKFLESVEGDINFEEIMRNKDSLASLYNSFSEKSLSDLIESKLGSAIKSAKQDGSFFGIMADLISSLTGIGKDDMMSKESYLKIKLKKDAGLWDAATSYLNNVLNPFQVWSNISKIYKGLMSDAPKWKKVLALFVSALAISGIAVNQLELIPDFLAVFLGPLAPGVVIDDINTSVMAVAYIFEKFGLLTDEEEYDKKAVIPDKESDNVEAQKNSLIKTLMKISINLDSKNRYELSGECDKIIMKISR